MTSCEKASNNRILPTLKSDVDDSRGRARPRLSEVCSSSARLLTVAFLLLTISSFTACAGEQVELVAVPSGGIQPQAVVDAQGNLHLVYYQGERKAGNLYYVTRTPDETEWSIPIRVNSEEGSANRNESISRAQMAIDVNGIVHVVWFNMDPVKYWYARKPISDIGFEKQRNLVTQFNEGVETGASVAVDGNGGVFVIWHAGDMANEDGRAVYITRSRDGGQTFTAEERVNPDDTGVCACCGLKSMVDDQGSVYVSYRAAGENIHRDMVLLKSTNAGQSFLSELVEAWELPACPVSTTTIAAGPDGAVVAWETEGQIFFAPVNKLTEAIGVPGEPAMRRKNPALAINNRGKIMIAWAEGQSYRSGGQLYWQVYTPDGEPTREKGQLEESLPDYSIPEVVTTKDGGFVIIY